MSGARPPADTRIGRTVFPQEEIRAAIARLAADIARDFSGKPLTLLGVLKGALYVTADLARALCTVAAGPSEIRIDYVALSSYGNANRSSGEVRMLKDAKENVAERNVVVIEDIVDDGLTLAFLQTVLRGRSPAILRSCVLVDKPYGRQANVQLDYVGLTAPDAFIVGYGLDYQERYRNLPYLAQLQPWIFPKAGPH